MSAHLIILDEIPVVRPVGVGETWCHFFAKCVLKVTVSEATHACKYYQIYKGLKLGIDGAVHRVQSIEEAN